MDYIMETVGLTVDAIIFGVCLKNYLKNKKSVSLLQGAPELEINEDLKDIVRTHPGQKLYASLRGIVEPIGDPIKSLNNKEVEGVVQLLTIREHVKQRASSGFWLDQKRLLQESHNVMAFVLQTNGNKVEVVDPLAADILDMDVISDIVTPTSSGLWDQIWGFFVGVRQGAVQTTEKMLRRGTLVTAVGELVTSQNKIIIQPPSNGNPYFLSNMQVSVLLRKLENNKQIYKWLSILFGTFGVFIASVLIKRYYMDYSKKIKDLELKKALKRKRLERKRKETHDENLTEAQLCVVCCTNPKEIILLPCGHVCLCEECSMNINDNCPVCRSVVNNKSVAYIS